MDCLSQLFSLAQDRVGSRMAAAIAAMIPTVTSHAAGLPWSGV